jgi:hypothetical protein
MTTTDTRTDGRHDFDFVMGRWRIHNRRLASLQQPGCTDWVEFGATSEQSPILGGLGNIDRYVAPKVLPGGHALEGFTLRLFNPDTGLWRIWWASDSRPGQLDPPVEGRFEDGHGRFECDDILNGQPIRVRFDWTGMSPESARWEQSFSYDGGATFESNWVMTMTRPA